MVRSGIKIHCMGAYGGKLFYLILIMMEVGRNMHNAYSVEENTILNVYRALVL